MARVKTNSLSGCATKNCKAGSILVGSSATSQLGRSAVLTLTAARKQLHVAIRVVILRLQTSSQLTFPLWFQSIPCSVCLWLPVQDVTCFISPCEMQMFCLPSYLFVCFCLFFVC